MDDWGIDAEDCIAAVRAGALDPDGLSAAELQASLDAYDAEVTARFVAMSDAEAEAASMRGAPIPPLPAPVESEEQARLRLDGEFAARMRAVETRSARVECARRALTAAHLQRVVDMPGDPGPRVRELASFAGVGLGLSGAAMPRAGAHAGREAPPARDDQRADAGRDRTLERPRHPARSRPATDDRAVGPTGGRRERTTRAFALLTVGSDRAARRAR